MIVNPKTVDPRDEKSPPVYQIETAMGSGISLFEGAAAVNVPRAPLPAGQDLQRPSGRALGLLCLLRAGGLDAQPRRAASAGRTEAIKIKLDSKYYGKFDLLEERFNEGEPSLVDCDGLTITGDVRFEKGVVICGAVAITNSGAAPAVIKAGTVIDRDLVL